LTEIPEQPDYQNLARQAVATAESQPQDVAVLLHAAMMLLHAGDTERSKRFARAALSVDPASFSALRTLSGILDATGERTEAISVGKEAIGIAPANTEIRLHVGAMLAAEQQWREAAEHLSIHVVSPAATPMGWRLLSSVLHHAGNTGRAADAARQAVTADPNNTEYRLNLASLLQCPSAL
jgi:Tfp pilus assembly protein PilF